MLLIGRELDFAFPQLLIVVALFISKLSLGKQKKINKRDKQMCFPVENEFQSWSFKASSEGYP